MSDARIVRVELEFSDGTIKRLTGESAEQWLADVNNVVAAAHLRYGQTQLSAQQWEIWRHSNAPTGKEEHEQ